MSRTARPIWVSPYVRTIASRSRLAFRRCEEHESGEILGDIVEPMLCAGRDKHNRSWLDVPVLGTNPNPRAPSCDDVDLILGVWRLRILGCLRKSVQSAGHRRNPKELQVRSPL